MHILNACRVCNMPVCNAPPTVTQGSCSCETLETTEECAGRKATAK